MDGWSRYASSSYLPFYNCQSSRSQWGNLPCLPFVASPGYVTPQIQYSRPARAPAASINNPRFQQVPRNPPLEVQQYLDTSSNGSDYLFKAKQGRAVVAQSRLHCDACKKSFQNNSSLDAHLQSHTKCPFPDCSFVASRQVLKLHEIQCHREGKLKIVLNTPEEIAKWREERRRNYPTSSNIEKKKEQQQQRIESGQVITEKEFRYNNRRGWRHHRGKRGSFRRRGQGKNNIGYVPPREPQHMKFDNKSSESQQDERGILPKENVSDVIGIVKDDRKAVSTVGALGALSNIYADSSSDEDDDDKIIHVEQSRTGNMNKRKEPEPASVQSCKKLKLMQDGVRNGKLARKKETSKRSKKENKQHIIPKRRKPSLLQMLLAPNIRHERNVLLQCLRYIVKKDFFGIGCDENANIS